MNICLLQPDAWPCPWRFCSYCTFVRQSCPVIHKTNSSYCYLQIKSAAQNRVWCLPHTHCKEWIYWYISQSFFAHALCLYAHISNSLFLTVPCSDLTLGWCFCVNIAEKYFVWIPLGPRYFVIYMYVCVCIYIKQYKSIMLSTCYYLYTNSLLEVWIRKCGNKSLK
jgi:hypothetical protein